MNKLIPLMVLITASVATGLVSPDAEATCSTGSTGACTAGVNDSAGAGNFGVVGDDFSTTGTYGAIGVYGDTYYSIGVEGQGLEAGSVGVLGLNTYDAAVEGASSYGNGAFFASTNNGFWTEPASVTAGVIGSGAGSGVYGVYGLSQNTNAIYGKNTNYSADAIYGDNSGDTSGTKAAVKGQSGSASGYGVVGQNTGGGVSVYGIGGTAVFGDNRDVSTGSYAAVNGQTADGSGYGGYFKNTGSTGFKYAGYFSGNVNITGTVTCGSGCSSDIRLKQNVKPLTGAIDQLLRLQGVTFEWRDPAEHQNHTGTQTGVIAQDVEKVEPQWVHELDETHMKAVDPDQRTVLALMVESFRTLKTENDARKAENAELREQVRALANGERPNLGAPRFDPNNIGWAVGGLAVGAYLVSRRKKTEQTAV